MPTTAVWTTSNVTVTDPVQHQDHLLASFVSNVVITVLIAVFLVVGTFGTLSTAVVISLNKHLHTKANIFIASLCLSDLISALICSPLWLYRRTWGFEKWEWGNLACKFYWVCDLSTNYATSLHIVSFAALRCVAMMAPFRIKKISTRMVFVYICFLWLISIGTALPLGLLMSVDFERGWLQENRRTAPLYMH
ncbi:unnamed protein product [Clavelina lepadiformis]|uniref:G-protein coupled receptors family 1 profile domain-containing protein n=1 Tax=Clavelina lepadiformis TaxID=159417 RepID=A0ABP0F1W5_CLALP